MKTNCPYCESNSFDCEAIPADVNAAIDSDDYGDWFNLCVECGKWSRYDDATGDQITIPEPEKRPQEAKVD